MRTETFSPDYPSSSASVPDDHTHTPNDSDIALGDDLISLASLATKDTVVAEAKHWINVRLLLVKFKSDGIMQLKSSTLDETGLSFPAGSYVLVGYLAFKLWKNQSRVA